ncbi:hypothetical protein LINPERHAP2_LOCUS39769 [Linum perenne]
MITDVLCCPDPSILVYYMTRRTIDRKKYGKIRKSISYFHVEELPVCLRAMRCTSHIFNVWGYTTSTYSWICEQITI